MERRLWMALVLSCMGLLGIAQNHANNWYFGNRAGLQFTAGGVVPQLGSQLAAYEGCSSYSDHNGNLFFYSDGLTIWNRNHVPMLNGTGLQGGNSATTSCMIVRQPNSCNLYYVFTTQDHGSAANQFMYSVVDMNLAGGLGGVVPGQKNILISNGVAEKIAVIKHANGTDYWIVTHYLNSGTFAAYRLTPTGFNLMPVTTIIGAFTASNLMIGFLKANHAGNRLVSLMTFGASNEMFDFDNSTGILSNRQILLSNLSGMYGAEFSPNDQLLYLCKTFSGCAIYQLDANNVASSTTLYTVPGNYVVGGLQLGPNGKIYVGQNTSAFLSVIDNPNVMGPGCNFMLNAQALSPGATSGIGICSFPPEQIDAFLPNGYDFTFADSCFGGAGQFASVGVVDYDSVRWDFGNPSSGSLNVGHTTFATHSFTAPGTYVVTMIVFGCEPDTVVHNITIIPCVLPTVDVRLDGYLQANEVHLRWDAEGPVADAFVVERRRAGGLFTPIARLKSTDLQHQQGNFHESAAGLGDEWAYRIALTDGNATIGYSNILTLAHHSTQLFQLQTHTQSLGPTYAIAASSPLNEAVDVQIMDIAGHRIAAHKIQWTADQPTVSLDLGEIPLGLYWVKLSCSKGTEVKRIFHQPYH